jgi:TPR repeat protein
MKKHLILMASALIISSASGAFAKDSATKRIDPAKGIVSASHPEDIPEDISNSYISANISELRAHAKQGDARAQFDLGSIYYSGEREGIPQNYVEAAKWYRKAADQGHAYAQYYLGHIYMSEEGGLHNDAEAVKWFRKAAEQGFAYAQSDLGGMYYQGLGVPKDYIESAKWLRKAAEQGDGLAQSNLSGMYQDGEGVTKDPAEAYFWFSLAENKTKEKFVSPSGVTDLEKQLSPEKLAEIQKRVLAWKPKATTPSAPRSAQ